MARLRKIGVSAGIFWVEAQEVGLRILCGCPADVIKHLMKRGLVATTDIGGVTFETGPNVILLSDVMIQNGVFANMAEFPVLQMLYRQGLLIPGHPNNTGQKPLLIGAPAQVRAQLRYIHRGNYGLLSEDELVEAAVPRDDAREMMRLKLKFAFGKIRDPSDLLDTIEVENQPVMIRDGVGLRRLRLNVFEFSLGDETVEVDLNLPPFETYECPYPLGFHYIPREYFAVVHSGEGDGWDINGPSMGSILMYQGRIYLIDAGPNILSTLAALGIGVNEIEGIFHTHSHDDHFAGLTMLFRADHRIKYFAAPMVRAAVAKKMAALLDIQESVFSDYFDVRDLVMNRWNDVDGLEVRPVFSPHPVETTVFFFRAMWVDGYRSYAHFADICSFNVLRSFIVDDPKAPGISEDGFRCTVEDYSVPADIKKLDIGGGMIHGDAFDFREDISGKIILAHTSQKHTVQQRAIGSAAAFGTVDSLIPSDHDFIWRSTFEILRSSFPSVPEHQIRALMNNQIVMFNPGTIVLRERQNTKDIWIILSGSVEVIHSAGMVRCTLSAGAIVGELQGLFGVVAAETYRAQGFVRVLRLPASLYSKFVRRNNLLDDITRLVDRRDFLQRSWLFREVVSTKTLNTIARDCEIKPVAASVVVDIAADRMGVIRSGRIGRYMAGHLIGTIGPGDFFGEERSVFWVPSTVELVALEPVEIMEIPAALVAAIPSVRWRLFEEWGRRINAYADGGRADSVGARLRGFNINVAALSGLDRILFDLTGAVMSAVELSDAVQAGASLTALIEFWHGNYGSDRPSEDHQRIVEFLSELRDDYIHGRNKDGSVIKDALLHWLSRHFGMEPTEPDTAEPLRRRAGQ